MNQNAAKSWCGRARAFTLVEVLIVVIVLGILAAIVVPQFSNASAKARSSMLADDLRTFRSQILVYKGQHRGVSPGYPGCDPTLPPTAGDLEAELIYPSDAEGNVDAGRTLSLPFGPYLSKIPANPINDKSSVKVLGDNEDFPAEPTNNDGWVYKPLTAELKSDCLGVDENNVPFFEY